MSHGGEESFGIIDRMISIGFWSGIFEKGIPQPKELIDHKWDLSERIRVFRYLTDGKIHHQRQLTVSCLMGCRFVQGVTSNDLTDGIYLWPDIYSHYIQVHSLKPPQDFLEHIRRNHYSVSILFGSG